MTDGLFLHTAAVMAIGAQLRAIRLAAGKTQVVLAAEIGVDQSVVSNVERGTRATTTDVLERWVKACNAEVTFTDSTGPLSAALALPEEDVGLLSRLVSLLTGAQHDPFRKAIILGTIEGAIDGAVKADAQPGSRRAVR